jgi:hypothetical protein
MTSATDIGHGNTVWAVVAAIVALHLAAFAYWIVA